MLIHSRINGAQWRNTTPARSTTARKSNHFDIEQRDLVEIQLGPPARFELSTQFVEVLRVDASNQPNCRHIAAHFFLDPEHRRPGLDGRLDATLSVTTS
jgi:hypothetical protein